MYTAIPGESRPDRDWVPCDRGRADVDVDPEMKAGGRGLDTPTAHDLSPSRRTPMMVRAEFARVNASPVEKLASQPDCFGSRQLAGRERADLERSILTFSRIKAV